MRLEEYVRCDAVGLADLIRAGEVTGAEVVSCALSAAETSTPYLNAFAEIYRDVLDRGMDCPASGPFSGVPFAVKDAGPLEAGRGMTYGSRLFQGFQADADSR